MKPASIIGLLTICGVTALAQNGVKDAPASASCIELNQIAMSQAASGHLAEAEASLHKITVSGDERVQQACRGNVLGNMAAAISVLGRLAEAERLAEQSVRILEKFYPPDDRALLRPLQIMAGVRLELGKTARAREAVERIQLIRIKHPQDSAVVHATVGALLQIEGRLAEAEAEYHDAFRAAEEAGGGESADAAAILHCLSSLYIAEHRLDEAGRALERAAAIHSVAKDALPADRAKLLELRGILHARRGEWQQSEEDLRDALAVADDQSSLDPVLLRSLLRNYSYALRKNHHRREARSIEARMDALSTDRRAAGIVDFTELLIQQKAAKR